MFKTVGELKESLKNFNDDMEIRIKLCFYDRNNFCVVQPDFYNDNIGHDKGIECCIYEENGCLIIENENSSDVDIFY